MTSYKIVNRKSGDPVTIDGPLEEGGTVLEFASRLEAEAEIESHFPYRRAPLLRGRRGPAAPPDRPGGRPMTSCGEIATYRVNRKGSPTRYSELVCSDHAAWAAENGYTVEALPLPTFDFIRCAYPKESR